MYFKVSQRKNETEVFLMNQQNQQENLHEYRVAKRFTMLQAMGGLALLGLLSTVVIKIIFANF